MVLFLLFFAGRGTDGWPLDRYWLLSLRGLERPDKMRALRPPSLEDHNRSPSYDQLPDLPNRHDTRLCTRDDLESALRLFRERYVRC